MTSSIYVTKLQEIDRISLGRTSLCRHQENTEIPHQKDVGDHTAVKRHQVASQQAFTSLPLARA